MTILCLSCVFMGANAQAQKVDTAAKNVQKADTSDKIKITIANSENFISTKTDSGEYNKFINNVVLYQGTDTLHCDSLYQNSTTKNFEAFGDVKVAQMGGTHGASDYLRYTTNQKLAFMRGNVRLTDGKNNLVCEELTYNLGTKIAVYDNWGQLHNDSTTVTSKSGIYNSADKNARFTTHVIVTDPQYNIRSEDLLYNTETKVTEFYAKSVVTRDNGKSILETKDGTYDGLHGVAHFTSHSSIWNDGEYIEGDTLYYNKTISYGLADGHVICIDTQQHSVLFCGHAEYFTRRRVLWATIKPVLLQVNSKDSLYMRADTFYSAPMQKLKVKTPLVKNQYKNFENVPLSKPIITEDTVNVGDTSLFHALNSPTAPQAYNNHYPFHVPDSIQLKADTIPPPDSSPDHLVTTKPDMPISKPVIPEDTVNIRDTSVFHMLNAQTASMPGSVNPTFHIPDSMTLKVDTVPPPPDSSLVHMVMAMPGIPVSKPVVPGDTVDIRDTSVFHSTNQQTEILSNNDNPTFHIPDSMQQKVDTVPPLDTVPAFSNNARKDSVRKNQKSKMANATKQKKPVNSKTNPPGTEQKYKLLYKVPDTRNMDTSAADTTAPLYFIGYHHVLIFSDSLQGKCDSVCYTRSDSTIRMMYKPIAWAHSSQVTGDTILLRLDSTKLKSMYVPNNAFVVSQSGPAKAELYDQVQGKTLTAFFKDNAINKIYVYPEAESIYYSKDEKGFYLGVDQATSDTMRIYFDGQKISKIFMEPEVHQVMTPMEKADLPNTKLSRFKWLIEQRPKSKEELFK